MSGDPVDTHLGTKLRTLRLEKNKTLQAIASDLGITYQQVRKYEKGTDRISASMLYRLAKVLNVQLAYFFEGIEHKELARNSSGATIGILPVDEGILEKIKDDNVKEAMRVLLQKISKLTSH